jgi:hypothetical protein
MTTMVVGMLLTDPKIQYFLNDELVILHTTLPHTIHTCALKDVANITAKMKLGLDRALREPILAAKSPLCKSALSIIQIEMHKYHTGRPCHAAPTTKVVPPFSPGLGYTHIVAYKLNHQWRQRQRQQQHP